MNADMKWLDNPEVFRVNQLEAHSDHCYYLDYSDMKKEKNPLFQSLNGQWEFSYSKNVKSRPVNFYEETFDASGFDKIMVPGHIELAGYDKVRYINTMYPWEGKEYHRGAYSMEATGAEKGMFSEAEYNPVGSYIKYFDLDKSMCGKRIHICFEGVEEASFLASSMGISLTVTFMASKILSLTIFSTRASSSGVTALKWVKSKWVILAS